MKGPSEKGDLFAVLEYMKGGQVVGQRHLQVVSMCSCSAWCMIARRVSNPNISRLLMLACENMGVNLNFHVSNTFLCLHAFGNMDGG